MGRQPPHFEFLYFSIIFLMTLLSQATGGLRPIVSLPKPAALSSFNINSTIQTLKSVETCDFSVTIVTSCSSPSPTRDQVSLTFGDAYGNQVYAPLHDPYTRTFERCSSDTYQVYGPCTQQICYLYIYRSGYDGWVPHDITVYGYNIMPAAFRYKDSPIPADMWYGLDYCSGGAKAEFLWGWVLLSSLVTVLYTLVGGSS